MNDGYKMSKQTQRNVSVIGAVVIFVGMLVMASSASAGVYSGIEYNSNTITADAGSNGYNDAELTTSGFETYIGYDAKASETLTYDIKAGYRTGETSIGDSTGSIGVDTSGYSIEAGFENKFETFTFYGNYEYSVLTSGTEDVPSHGFTTGVRFDF